MSVKKYMNKIAPSTEDKPPTCGVHNCSLVKFQFKNTFSFRRISFKIAPFECMQECSIFFSKLRTQMIPPRPASHACTSW